MAILVGYTDSISIYRIQLQNKRFKTIRAAICTFLPSGLLTGLPTGLSEPPSEPRYDLRPRKKADTANEYLKNKILTTNKYEITGSCWNKLSLAS